MDRSDNTKEEWRDYPENPKYSVSSEGRVLGPLKILQPTILESTKGNKYYYLTIGKKLKTLATVVAQTFLSDPPFVKNKVKFIDGNTLNCKAENLRWMNSQDYISLPKK